MKVSYGKEQASSACHLSEGDVFRTTEQKIGMVLNYTSIEKINCGISLDNSTPVVWIKTGEVELIDFQTQVFFVPHAELFI